MTMVKFIFIGGDIISLTSWSVLTHSDDDITSLTIHYYWWRRMTPCRLFLCVTSEGVWSNGSLLAMSVLMAKQSDDEGRYWHYVAANVSFCRICLIPGEKFGESGKQQSANSMICCSDKWRVGSLTSSFKPEGRKEMAIVMYCRTNLERSHTKRRNDHGSAW
jgi:hypothetical protein